MHIFRHLKGLLVVALLLVTLWQRGTTAAAQGPDAVQVPEETDWTAEAQAIFDAMTVEERVGQLFVVTFSGDRVLEESIMNDLILTYKVGGVILSAANSNFTDLANTPRQAAELTNGLQLLVLTAAAANHPPARPRMRADQPWAARPAARPFPLRFPAPPQPTNRWPCHC
jgi:hypothetical protein